MTRHIFAGSEAGEPRSPGRAGPRRLRPPVSALSYPVASRPLILGEGAGRGSSISAPATRDAVRDALRPHARWRSPPTPTLPPSGAAGALSVTPFPAPPYPSQPLGSPLPSPGPSSSAAALVCARQLQSAPATDGERGRCGCPSRAAAPSRPCSRPGTTCWDGSPGGGSSKSIMLSWGRCFEAPRRRPCSGCRGLERTRRYWWRRRLLGDPRNSLLPDLAGVADRALVPLRLPPREGGARAQGPSFPSQPPGPTFRKSPTLAGLTQEAGRPGAGKSCGRGSQGRLRAGRVPEEGPRSSPASAVSLPF